MSVMRVLVTRPEGAAARTAARLEAAGFTPVLLPVSETIAVPEALTGLDPDGYRGLVVTSARAAAVLHATIGTGDDPGLAARWRRLGAYAVGAATGDALRAIGFKDVEDAGGTADELAASLITAWRMAASGDGNRDAIPTLRPYLYLAGDPRSPRLEAALAAAGVPVETRVVYRMAPRAVPEAAFRAALFDPPAAAVLLYSRETAALFFALVDRYDGAAALKAMRIVCLSAQVADAVPAALADRIEIAAAPDEASLLAQLAAKAT